MFRSRLLPRAAAFPPPRLLALPPPPPSSPARLLATLSTPPSAAPTDAQQPGPALGQSTGRNATSASASRSRPSYVVYRTPSQNLPVYEEHKRGGTLKRTVIRKVEGDSRALKTDLMRDLSLSDDQIRVNPVTRHIEILGHRKSAIASYLEKQGF
ncbi:hypothetical protein VTK73DRAFT_4638 [Phialemonium thermophilum]|uniref:Large ribosomal subunit protein mL49 n=1 Tax=Phialemonium thermophilum TaxID=223376 RepID=A0ABR3V893_9PEZI